MFYLILGIIFGGIGSIFYKLAEEKMCNRLWINTISRLTIAFSISLYIIYKGSFQFNLKLLGVVLLGGISVFFGRWFFMRALRHGKVSISWIMLNLAVLIPVLASIFIWKEIPDAKKILGMCLIPVSLILLREKESIKCG